MAALNKKNKRELAKAFKLSGLTISGEAMKSVWRQLSREEEREEALQVIIDGIKTYLKQNPVAGAAISQEIVEKVVADLSKDDDDRVQESLQLVSAFEQAHLAYKREKKEFFIVPAAVSAVNGSAAQKIDMYRTRLALVHERVLRNRVFRPPVAVTSSRANGGQRHVKLCPVESLIGTTGVQCVLGMLFRHHGKLFLEDYNSSIELRIIEGETVVTPGIYTETCVVLAEGEYNDGMFDVCLLGLPPPEPRKETIPVLGNISMLGLDFNSEAYANTLRVETQEEAPPLVVLSEVHLDRPEVLDKLRRMFDQLSSLAPSLIVFLGNFSAQPFGNSYADRSRYQKGFDALADILAAYPDLSAGSTRFIFVPGANDPGGANVLPRLPIPRVFARKLFQRVQNVHFTSNPARVRFYTQEFVFFRENLVSKLRRHQLLEPTPQDPAASGEAEGEADGGGGGGDGGGGDGGGGGGDDDDEGASGGGGGGEKKRQGKPLDVTEVLAKTILDQGHLCPLPLTARPVFWGYDHALRIYPQPSVVFAADQYDQYCRRYHGTLVANPGSFSTDFSLLVYWPSAGNAEFNRVE